MRKLQKHLGKGFLPLIGGTDFLQWPWTNNKRERGEAHFFLGFQWFMWGSGGDVDLVDGLFTPKPTTFLPILNNWSTFARKFKGFERSSSLAIYILILRALRYHTAFWRARLIITLRIIFPLPLWDGSATAEVVQVLVHNAKKSGPHEARQSLEGWVFRCWAS